MKAGCVLGNKYEIVDVLGSGGMGKVYLARNINLGTLWAIKELSKATDALEDIRAEVNILKNLDHPSLPKVFDVFESKDSYFIIFTYINGTTLSKKLSEVGKFDERTVVIWGIELCDVLSYLHKLKPRPIIYRDLKPSNIMLTSEGSIKLIDFGIAREYKPESAEDTVFIGTRGYAAPEQYGLGQSGPYTDIYSLGITLRQLLTGESPLSSSFMEQVNGNISKELLDIIEKCTDPGIDKRYSKASDVKEELNFLLSRLDGKNSKGRGNRAVYKIEKRAFFKQKILSLDNAVFSSELAVAASLAGLNVLLVDTHSFTPVCDFYLGIQKQYREFTIMREPDKEGLSDIEEFIKNVTEYIYRVPNIDGLSYLSLEPGILSETYINELFSKTGGFDLVLFSASINCLSSNTKALFNGADKILIAGKLSFDCINYWNRVVTRVSRDFGIDKGKMCFIGWLYDRSKSCILKDIDTLLGDIKFIGTISDFSKRYFNTNFTTGAAILNFRDAKKEYNRILFDLNLSPIGFTENTLFSILNLVRLGRN